jgi:large-conductance mechanosensitive channel
MSSLPENINFGNPNANPASYQFYSNQTTENKDIPSKKNNDIKSQETTDKILNFLNIQTSTILTFAIAMAIGFGIKDFLNSMVMNVLQPSIINLILTIDKNDYLPITSSLREKNPQIEMSKFLGSLLVLKLIVGITYLIYIYSNILNPLKLL